MTGRQLFVGLALAAWLLAGCARPAEPRLSDPATRATLVAAAPTITPRPGEIVPTLAPTRMPTPNLTAATPYATPRPQSDFFEVVELGFRVDHPFHWSRSSGAVPGTLMQLANRADNVFVLILASPLDGAGLEQAAADIHGRVAAWLGGMEQTDSAAVTLGEAVPAWRSEYEAAYPEYNLTIRSLVVSVAHGKQLITMAAYAQDQHLAAERETVEAIVRSVRLSEPTVFGLPRSETYVYAEREAVEAWAADPARGPGDRRVFGGLVSLDPQQRLQSELADSWAIGGGGTVYTFTLRAGAAFHDGRPVTAADVAYSWERALDPRTDSAIALAYLGDIVGAAERAGGAATTVRGLRVLDERTLEVTIDGPKPYFLLKLTAPPAAVVDRANVQQGADWYRRPNGTGPYRLISWMPGRAKLYERSERYVGEPPPTRYLAARLDVGSSGAYRYRVGELDQATLDGSSLGLLDDPESPLRADTRQAARLCTTAVGFDTTRPPFDDPKVRQAFALAVDRQRYAERAEDGASLAAHGLFPPGLPGYNAELAAPAFDVARAKALLAESRYAGALPPITLTSSGYGFWVDPGVGVLVQMWQEQLGAEIVIEQLEPVARPAAARAEPDGNLFFWEWCADYPDPESFAGARFHSGAPQNAGGYVSDDLDALVERARVEPDVARRMALYQEAERLIVTDAAAIFLAHRVDTLLVAPRVAGPVSAPGHVPVERYITLEQTP